MCVVGAVVQSWPGLHNTSPQSPVKMQPGQVEAVATALGQAAAEEAAVIAADTAGSKTSERRVPLCAVICVGIVLCIVASVAVGFSPNKSEPVTGSVCQCNTYSGGEPWSRYCVCVCDDDDAFCLFFQKQKRNF